MQRDRANMQSTINALIEDNTSESITPADVRNVLTDFNDSMYNNTDDLSGQLSATVTISSAEILDLFTTPKVLVPAAGANKAIVPTRITVKYKYNTTTYTTNTSIQFKIGSTSIDFCASVLGAAVSNYATFTAASASSITSFNTDLVAQVQTGNPLAGNGTLTIIVSYFILDMS